jgi:hypothetical protein
MDNYKDEKEPDYMQVKEPETHYDDNSILDIVKHKIRYSSIPDDLNIDELVLALEREFRVDLSKFKNLDLKEVRERDLIKDIIIKICLDNHTASEYVELEVEKFASMLNIGLITLAELPLTRWNLDLDFLGVFKIYGINNLSELALMHTYNSFRRIRGVGNQRASQMLVLLDKAGLKFSQPMEYKFEDRLLVLATVYRNKIKIEAATLLAESGIRVIKDLSLYTKDEVRKILLGNRRYKGINGRQEASNEQYEVVDINVDSRGNPIPKGISQLDRVVGYIGEWVDFIANTLNEGKKRQKIPTMEGYIKKSVIVTQGARRSQKSYPNITFTSEELNKVVDSLEIELKKMNLSFRQ